MMTSGISQEDIIMTSLYVTPLHQMPQLGEDHIATKNGTINATPNKLKSNKNMMQLNSQ